MSDTSQKRPMKVAVPVDLWKCEDLKQIIKETVRAHVKDVELAKKLEQALGDNIVYGDGGGGGNVAAA
jgi:hypothetical protein